MAKLEGFKHLAVIEKGNTGYDKKDCYYALYDDTICAGDMVVVTGAACGKILAVKAVVSVSEAEGISPKNICAEIIGKVDVANYLLRTDSRKRAEQIRKKLVEKQKEIEARKDDDYYASIDPEYAKMLEELRSLFKA